jgi:hypothetical protein
MVDSFYKNYVGHCPLSEVYLIYVDDVSVVSSTPVFGRFLVVTFTHFYGSTEYYLLINDDGWDRTCGLLNGTYANH